MKRGAPAAQGSPHLESDFTAATFSLANLGDPEAMLTAGILLQAQNVRLREACEFFRKAAGLGNTEAAYRFAECLRLGVGTRKHKGFRTISKSGFELGVGTPAKRALNYYR